MGGGRERERGWEQGRGQGRRARYAWNASQGLWRITAQILEMTGQPLYGGHKLRSVTLSLHVPFRLVLIVLRSFLFSAPLQYNDI